MKILIADDEELVRENLKDILRGIGQGDDLHEAVNGRTLIEHARTIKPDVCFVDIRMPGISGLDAIEKLTDDFPHTSWIILSGYADFDYARRALSLRVSEYLLKPASESEVGAALEKVCEKRREAQELRHERTGDFPELKNTRGEWGSQDSSGQSSRIVRQAEKLVREQYTQAIGVAQVADQLHVTPNYLSSQFKKYKKVSFTQFITDIRLKKAPELLRKPGITVKEAAYRLGYLSSRHFTKLFRKRYGVTPSEYRK